MSRGEEIVGGGARPPRWRVSSNVAKATAASAAHVDRSMMGRLRIQWEGRTTQPCKERGLFKGGRRSVHMLTQDMARYSCDCVSKSKADILQPLSFIAKTGVS